MPVIYKDDTQTKFRNPITPHRWIKTNGATHLELCRRMRLGRLPKEFESEVPPCPKVKSVGRQRKVKALPKQKFMKINIKQKHKISKPPISQSIEAVRDEPELQSASTVRVIPTAQQIEGVRDEPELQRARKLVPRTVLRQKTRQTKKQQTKFKQAPIGTASANIMVEPPLVLGSSIVRYAPPATIRIQTVPADFAKGLRLAREKALQDVQKVIPQFSLSNSSARLRQVSEGVIAMPSTKKKTVSVPEPLSLNIKVKPENFALSKKLALQAVIDIDPTFKSSLESPEDFLRRQPANLPNRTKPTQREVLAQRQRNIEGSRKVPQSIQQQPQQQASKKTEGRPQPLQKGKKGKFSRLANKLRGR